MTALAGKCTYRSFHNNPAPVTDSAETALGLFFAEVDVTLADAPGDKLTGGIDWPGGDVKSRATRRPRSRARRPASRCHR